MSGFDVNAAAQRISAEFHRLGVGAAGAAPSEKSDGESFGEVLQGFMKETNEVQVQADGELGKLVRGETDDVQGVMLAMAKADVSFRMMLEVRNKLLDAYQEVMRMQV